MPTKYLENTDAITYMLEDGNRVLLHVVNCQGVMGSGIAAQIKERVPQAFDIYRKEYKRGALMLGDVIFRGGVASLIAQEQYGRGKRQLNYGALSTTLHHVMMWDSTEFVVPYLMGCDRAGGDWEVVLEMLEWYLPNLTVCKL